MDHGLLQDGLVGIWDWDAPLFTVFFLTTNKKERKLVVVFGRCQCWVGAHDRIRPERYARSYTQRVIICAVAVASNQITKKAEPCRWGSGFGWGDETSEGCSHHMAGRLWWRWGEPNPTEPTVVLFRQPSSHTKSVLAITIFLSQQPATASIPEWVKLLWPGNEGYSSIVWWIHVLLTFFSFSFSFCKFIHISYGTSIVRSKVFSSKYYLLKVEQACSMPCSRSCAFNREIHEIDVA